MDRYQKVKRLVTDPVIAFYGGKEFPDAVLDAFVEDLGDFTEAELAAAWKDVRTTCKTRPGIAHFVTAVRDARPKPVLGVSNPVDRGEYRNHRNTALAEKTMRSPIGQLGLRLGVGQTVWMRAWRDSVVLTEAQVYWVRDEWKAACELLARLPDDKRLHSFYDAIQEKERELFARYSKEAA